MLLKQLRAWNFFKLMHILGRYFLQMTVTEKIANAKKRINELEALIEYWGKYDKKSVDSIVLKTSKV